MPDCESTLKGLSEVSEYLLAKTDIAGVGKGKEVFGFWYRSVEDAIALLKEQEPAKPVVDARDGWYRCGECGNGLASGERVRSFGSYKWPVYCEMCGRKVDWDA